MSRNQIIELKDGTFQIGQWVLNTENKAIFMEIDEAGDLPTAIAKADAYDDEDFKVSKSMVEIYGGIDAANNIIETFNELNAIALVHKKGIYDHENHEFLNQAQFEKFMDEESQKNETSDQDYITKGELEQHLKTIRFVTF
jgi:hypothetical protein